MIEAEKKWLETRTRLNVLRVSERELELFIQSANACATLVTILALFCYDGFTTGYIYEDIDHDLCGKKERGCAEFLYPLFNIVTTFLSLTTLWRCMLVTMFAPHWALHGSPGDFNTVVKKLEVEFIGLLGYVAASLVSFFMTAVVWSWSDKDIGLPSAGILTLQLCGSFFVIYLFAMYLGQKLHPLSVSELVRSRKFGFLWKLKHASGGLWKHKTLNARYGDVAEAKAMRDNELHLQGSLDLQGSLISLGHGIQKRLFRWQKRTSENIAFEQYRDHLGCTAAEAPAAQPTASILANPLATALASYVTAKTPVPGVTAHSSVATYYKNAERQML